MPPNFPLVNHGHSPSRGPILTSILSLGLSHSLLFRLSLDPTHGHSLRLIVSASKRLSPTPVLSHTLRLSLALNLPRNQFFSWAYVIRKRTL